MKVKNIILKGFRGSTQAANVVFDTSKSLSLIFGENGTGKSTIIDGFDFLCNQTFGSLVNYSIGKSAKTYVPSHGKKADDCSVDLISDYGSWKAVLSGSNISVTPESDIPDAKILRRPAILRLIEQQPKDRFNELKSFISVPGADKLESVFRDAIKETKKLFDEYTRSLSQAKDALEEMWIQSDKNGSSSISWAEERVKADTSEEQKEIDKINELMNYISVTYTALTALNTANINEAAAIKIESEASTRQQNFEVKQKEKDSELLLLLQKAQTYLKGHSNTGKCPVCETEQNIDDLSLKVSKRITDMDEMKSFSTATQQAKSQVEAKKILKISAEKYFFESLKVFVKTASNSSSKILTLLDLDNKFVQDSLVALEFSGILFNLFSSWYDSFLESNKIKLNSKKNELQKNITLKSTILTHLNIVKEKKALAKIKEKTLADLKALLLIVEKERKDYIDNILDTISVEVESLYSSLHPDEKVGNARFYLNPDKIGSLEFDASFQGTEEIPPQAYYSESHLDTLGICVFIALSKHYKTSNTILILDDVLTSVDAQHMDRFMKMLHEQSKVFNQIIVTTHYRPWKDRYKYTRSSVSNIDVIEIGPWSLQTGIKISQFKGAVEELKDSILDGNFDRQVTASKAGIVLESVLDFLTLKYSCALPRNGRNEYTLGELVGGIDSKLSKLLKIKKNGAEIELKSLLDSSVNAQWIRNSVGCHFNLQSSDVPDHEIKDFANSVISISNIIICPKCFTLPKKNSGSFWQCSCKDNHLELHPLTQPGTSPRCLEDGE